MPLASNNNSGNIKNGVSATNQQIVANGGGNGTNYEYTTTNIPAFLSKLWTLVEDPKYDQLIAWDASGFSFHVFDQTRFAKEILPRFFKHNNMASFIRQLNMYGFRKVNSIDHGSLKNEKEDLEFHHPYFIRGKEQFLEFIKRKVPDVKPTPGNASTGSNTPSSQVQPAALQVSPTSQPVVQYSNIKPEELNKVLEDVNTIKSKQKYVDDSLMDVKKENEVLWKEIATLRQKHHHQQQIVNKLIHFLVHLVNPASLGIKRTRPLMIDSHSANSLANVDILNGAGGDLSDNEDACGGEINEIDEEDEEEFLAANSTLSNSNRALLNKRLNLIGARSHPDHHLASYLSSLDEPSAKRAKLNNNTTTAYVSGAGIGGGNGGVRQPVGGLDVKTIQLASSMNKQAKYVQTPNVGGTKSTGGSLIGNVSYLDENGQSFNGNSGGYSTANQGGVVINEIIDSPVASNLLGAFEPAKEVKSVNTNNGEFIDANLFLNPTPAAQSDAAGPIITTPASPLEDSIKNAQRNGSSSFLSSTLANGQPALQLNEPVTLDPSSDLMKRSLSLKNSSSNQQMSDHVEALQLDLNSIKEFLSSNSFNQIDPYTISNLFSPLDLETVENESFYLEPTLGPSDKMLKQIAPALDTIIPTLDTASTTTSIDLGQRALGNGGDLVQYEEEPAESKPEEFTFTKPAAAEEVKWSLGDEEPPSRPADTSLLLDDDVVLSTPLIDQEQAK